MSTEIQVDDMFGLQRTDLFEFHFISLPLR
jgi:hypothetical protein